MKGILKIKIKGKRGKERDMRVSQVNYWRILDNRSIQPWNDFFCWSICCLRPFVEASLDIPLILEFAIENIMVWVIIIENSKTKISRVWDWSLKLVAKPIAHWSLKLVA